LNRPMYDFDRNRLRRSDQIFCKAFLIRLFTDLVLCAQDDDQA
jgi:hypothetical protein